MRMIRIPVIALVAVAALGACDTGQPTKQSEAPVAGTSDINPQPREKLKTGGSLRLAIQQWITQYNVGHVDGTQGDGASIVAMIQPQLWTPDDNGTVHANPDVLVSAEVTATSPSQVVTYKLNPKATWSDGKPITWRDFEIQWKTRNGTSKQFGVAGTTGYDQIKSVEKGADDREAKVTFDKPYGDWKSIFDPLLPGDALDTPEKFNQGWIEKVPVWGGPWKIGSMDKTSETITLVPNDKYWGTKPILDSVVYRALDSTAITDAFLNKEIDQAPGRQADAYKRLSAAADTAIRIGARWDETHLTLGSSGPLADVKVRQAIGNAVDRAAIAKAQSSGLPFSVNTLGSHFFMPSQKGYKDNSGEYGKFDVAKAKALLTEAGWAAAAEGQPRTKDGKPLKVSYIVSSGSTSDVPQLVQNMLAQAGVQVDIQQVPGNEFFQKYVNTGSFDLVSFRGVDQIFPSTSLPTYTTNGEQNFGKIGTPEIDKLLTTASAETDPQKAIDLYNQADVLIWQAGHTVELFQTPQISAVRKGLAGYGAFGLRGDKQLVDTGWEK